MRLILFVLLWCASCFAIGTDALVLLDADAAGPKVDPSLYYHPTWVFWPPATNNGSNRVLSVASGLDWHGEQRDLAFREEEQGSWENANFGSLEERGFFLHRPFRVPSVATSPSGYINPAVLFVGLTKVNRVAALRWEDRWPPQGVVAIAARNWDEVRSISDRCRGRVLILEFPPPRSAVWSRLWLRGSGWPDGLPTPEGVPGMVRASALGRLIERPTYVPWRESRVERWGGANRWLEFFRTDFPSLRTLLIGALSVVLLAGIAVVLREQESRLLARLLLLAALAPAILVVGGQLTYLFGFQGWRLWYAFSAFLLISSAWCIRFVLRRADTVSMLPVALVGSAALVLCDPTWSVLGDLSGAKSLYLGSLVAYVSVVVLSLLRGVRWIFAGIIAGAALYFGRIPLAVAVGIAVVAAESWPGSWFALYLPIPGLVQGTLAGVTWAPSELLRDHEDLGRLNIARHFQFLVSAPFVACLAVAVGLSLFSDGFFWHQMKVLLRQDPRVKRS